MSTVEESICFSPLPFRINLEHAECLTKSESETVYEKFEGFRRRT